MTIPSICRTCYSVLKTEIQQTPMRLTWSKYLHKCAALSSIQTADEKAALPVYKLATKDRRRTDRIYVWGFAQFGALGKKQFLKPTSGQKPIHALHKPCRLELGHWKVVDLACGYGFTLLAIKDHEGHKVLGTGINADSQLGLHEARRGHPLEFLIVLTPMPIPFHFPSKTKVTVIGCGRAHTIISTDTEGIFCLGNNAFGQCGRPIVEGEKYSGNPAVHKVRGLENVTIKKVVCGSDHTLFLTEEGEVYACGWGADGQTGIGHYNNEWMPTKVKGDIDGEKIVNLSSTADCVLAVADQGDLFGWGNSEYCQLSAASDEQQVCVSRHLALPNIGKVKEVASAGTMCGVLNEEGRVFVWGYGILGKGPAVQHIKGPEEIPPTLFGRNEFNPDSVVKHLTCGLHHFAAITNAGDLYMWGKNNKACLGLGHNKDQFFPFKVSVPAEVTAVSCGVDHTGIIGKSFV